MRRTVTIRPSWDAAIRAVQDDLRELSASEPMTDEAHQILISAFLRCEKLLTRRSPQAASTTRELAAKYAISERTVRYWRREGCPFPKGQPHVLKWIAARRYAPAGTEAKFKRQLDKLKRKALFAGLPEVLANIRHVKWLYREHGMQPEDWMRNFRAKRGKAQFAPGDARIPTETMPPTNGEPSAETHG